jgi:hypothetical protein
MGPGEATATAAATETTALEPAGTVERDAVGKERASFDCGVFDIRICFFFSRDGMATAGDAPGVRGVL